MIDSNIEKASEFFLKALDMDRNEKYDSAKSMYFAAAALAENTLDGICHDNSEMLGFLAVSAASSYYLAGAYQDAERVVDENINRPNLDEWSYIQLDYVLQELEKNEDI